MLPEKSLNAFNVYRKFPQNFELNNNKEKLN